MKTAIVGGGKGCRSLLEFMGIDPRRFQISWVSAAEGAKWSDVVSSITDLARELGPFDRFERLPDKRIEQLCKT